MTSQIGEKGPASFTAYVTSSLAKRLLHPLSYENPAKSIHEPNRMSFMIHQVRVAIEGFEAKNGRRPDFYELYDAIPSLVLDGAEDSSREFDEATLRGVLRIGLPTHPYIPIYRLQGEVDGVQQSDSETYEAWMVPPEPADTRVNVEQAVIDHVFHRMLTDKFLDYLPPLERRVIEIRYGIVEDGSEEAGCREESEDIQTQLVAEGYVLPPNKTVKQIKEQAMIRMRDKYAREFYWREKGLAEELRIWLYAGDSTTREI
jgi:hypothetical protein